MISTLATAIAQPRMTWLNVCWWRYMRDQLTPSEARQPSNPNGGESRKKIAAEPLLVAAWTLTLVQVLVRVIAVKVSKAVAKQVIRIRGAER